ncbi:MAG: hypothetical protein NT165_00155 [Candidatus Falkowbacteria bacterium]|nr:hypothetical protein [Candidatus Falkowbacteria bacterium]
MKFTTIVIIQSGPEMVKKIRESLSKKSKVYLSSETISMLSILPNVDMSDNQAIAKAFTDTTGEFCEVDEGGIYYFSTAFKSAVVEHYRKKIDKPLMKLNFLDSYDIFDAQMTNDFLNMVDGYDRFPDAIVTTDLKLIRAPKAFMFVDENSSDYQDFLAWQKEFKQIVAKYSQDSFCLILDCHV